MPSSIPTSRRFCGKTTLTVPKSILNKLRQPCASSGPAGQRTAPARHTFDTKKDAAKAECPEYGLSCIDVPALTSLFHPQVPSRQLFTRNRPMEIAGAARKPVEICRRAAVRPRTEAVFSYLTTARSRPIPTAVMDPAAARGKQAAARLRQTVFAIRAATVQKPILPFVQPPP